MIEFNLNGKLVYAILTGKIETICSRVVQHQEHNTTLKSDNYYGL